MPPYFLEVELSAWLNACEQPPLLFGRDADARVAHRDRQLHACRPSVARVPGRADLHTTTSPLAVNLNALPTRLVSTCRSSQRVAHEVVWHVRLHRR